MKNAYFKSLVHNFLEKETEYPAFKSFNGKAFTEVSYPQFAADILSWAGALRRKFGSGKHIALISAEDYDFFTAVFACFVTGNVAVILNPDLPGTLLRWQCDKADIDCIFYSAGKIAGLQQDLGEIPYITAEDLRGGEALPLEDVVDDDGLTALMMFTSGTTGKSKVVELTGGNLKAGANSANVMYDIPGLDYALHAIPRYHIGGFRTAMVCLNRLETMNIGRGIRYLFLDIPAFNPKCIVVVPAMLEGLLKYLRATKTPEERQKFLGTSLCRICVGGAALKPQTAKYFMDLGMHIDVIYGMTETTCIATWCGLDEKHIRSIGKPFGGMECRLEEGEIMIKGPAVMKGYYKDPVENAKIFEGEWLHSGDIGRIDEDGYFYLTGRKKNVIILSNGENVNPEEIEDKLYEIPAVLECMVYGDGKGIRADVYTEDEAAAAQAIREYNEEAPTYHQVYKVDYYAQPLEKTGSGKIKRKENIYEQ